MKKILLILCLLLALACMLAACDAKSESPDGNSPTGGGGGSDHTHVFGDWTVSRAATCSAVGEEKRSCTCGASETRELKAAHTFGGWTVTAAPTCNQSGTRTRSCTVCGSTENGTVPATGEHNYTPANTCGDCGFVLQYTSSGIVYGGSGDTCFVSSVDTNIGENIVIPAYYNGKRVTRIGYSAFSGTAIQSVTIPGTVTEISEYAFNGCTALTSITIPGSVTAIGRYAFIRCTALTRVSFGADSKLETIAAGAFGECTALREFDIPDSVKRISLATSVSEYNNAFLNCTQLIQKSGGVHYVDNWAVACDSGVTNAQVRSGTVGIADYAFYYRSLSSVSLPDSLKTIGNAAFCYCQELTGITIPDSVTDICGNAFEGCSALASVKLPNTLTAIEHGVFMNCSSLTSLDIPASVVSVGSSAFPSQLYVREGGVSYVGSWAVGCDANVANVTLRTGTVGIADYAFGYCHLTSITLPQGVKSIGVSAFYNCDDLTSITLPQGVKSIGDKAFYSCDALTSITLPQGLESIGEHAFYSCSSLYSITIPSSVTSIGWAAFDYCYDLDSVTFENPNGWTVTNGSTTQALSAADLANTSKAASYLRYGSYGSTSYAYYTWTRE